MYLLAQLVLLTRSCCGNESALIEVYNMSSGPSADFSGEEMGAGVGNTPPGNLTPGTSALGSALSAPAETFRARLHPDQPFGITVIVGGTNIRACVSLPGATTPLNFSLTWQELSDELTPELAAKKVEFGDAHDLVLSRFVTKFFDQLRTDHCDPEDAPPPFDKLAALNFSVAGVVRGDGIDATVSTTNTGLHFSEEELAKRMIRAMQSDLAQRKWPPFSIENVAVLNDAAAGCKGEVLRGALRGCANGLFVILGTGIGSMGWSSNDFDFRFDELGHRIVKDSLPEGTAKPQTLVNLFRLLAPEEYAEQVAADGSFLPFKVHQMRYAENVIAGPWLAVRFLKKELTEDEALINALAKNIAPMLGKEQEEVYDELTNLMDFSAKDLTRWAVDSNARLVRAVNHFILNFDAWEFSFALPYTGSYDAALTPERRLANYGFKVWKTYWTDVGHFIATAYGEMKQQGVAPQKIVLGGGIGEAYHRFGDPLRKAALREIHEHSGLPEGTVVFSAISAEERESAITQAAVDQAAQKLAMQRDPDITTIH
jgi:hypothetical protein